MNDEGIQKSAILLMSLGEDHASQVLKYLGPREVQKLGLAMANLKHVSRAQVEEVLGEFQQRADEKTTLGMDSAEYVKGVLTKALGDDKAAALIERILHGGDTSGIEGLKWMDSAAIADLVTYEHPQIIATILVHLDYEQASEVLSHFTERLRNDVLLRIATLDGIQPNALRELNEVLTNLLAGSSTNMKKTVLGGVRTAAEILNFLPGAQETAVIDSVREYDSELAQKIVDEMFIFDHLVELDDRGIQTLLREVESDCLIIALKGASEALREKILKNMSQRAAEQLREDLETKGPVRVSEVETQQKAIQQIARRLSDEGTIILGKKGDDAFV